MVTIIGCISGMRMRINNVQHIGYQNLEFMLMDTLSQDVIQKDRLPLQRNTQLTWIGFSEAMVGCYTFNQR